ncbi:MAG: amidohydrolase, partial [Acholeplasmataceae bacterium]|nr:amidohydrolase [Acholeplasmataceae bacterium]
ILIGAKSLAMTAYDIFTDTALQKDISAEFAKVPKR